MCSGSSSEWNVEVLEGGGEVDLEEGGEEIVEDVPLAVRGWEYGFVNGGVSGGVNGGVTLALPQRSA